MLGICFTIRSGEGMSRVIAETRLMWIESCWSLVMGMWDIAQKNYVNQIGTLNHWNSRKIYISLGKESNIFEVRWREGYQEWMCLAIKWTQEGHSCSVRQIDITGLQLGTAWADKKEAWVTWGVDYTNLWRPRTTGDMRACGDFD